MRRRAILLLVCSVLAAAGRDAWGDGKFFRSEGVPPTVPYQRALLVHDGVEETLILQSKYAIVGGGGASDLGWVIPLPAPPVASTLDPDDAEDVFRDLDLLSTPYVRRIRDVAGFVFLLATAALVLGTLTAWLRRGSSLRAHRKPLLALSSVLVLALFLGALGSTSMSWSGRSKVEVLQDSVVGIYDLKVVRSEDGSALAQWLGDRGFLRDPGDDPVVAEYARRGWCFVAAKVSVERAAASGGTDSEGLAAPLVLRFPTPRAVYPLGLTATALGETVVLLYAFAPHRLATDGRLETRYAGRGPVGLRDLLERTGDPATWNGVPARGWLVKLKGRLSPERMREDLWLDPAPDEPHRETVWRW